jgi:hypothetical protein
LGIRSRTGGRVGEGKGLPSSGAAGDKDEETALDPMEFMTLALAPKPVPLNPAVMELVCRV